MKFNKFKTISVLGLPLALIACGAQEVETSETPAHQMQSSPATPDPSQITLGNGKLNNVTLDGSSRSGSTFTFPNVNLDKPGFLVMHPFKDGTPVQTVYVGATPLSAGAHSDVNITVSSSPQTGDNFIVMLHYDMNEDGIFDFNDGVTVPDAPIFEGKTLVALRYTAP